MKLSKKKLILILVCIFLLFAILISYYEIKQEKENKKIIENNYITTCEKLGLENVSLVMNKDDYDFYNITVNCSNLSDFTNEGLIEIDKELSNFEDSYVTLYCSEGDEYLIDSSSLIIRKNGNKFYDDNKNSESYKKAQSNEMLGSEYTGIEVTDDDELGTCWALAEEVVESKLKSPSSAKFPFSYGDEDVSITMSGNTYTVKAWVEAENSFGATLRSNFTVTMTKSGSEFTAESCDIDEE